VRSEEERLDDITNGMKNGLRFPKADGKLPGESRRDVDRRTAPGLSGRQKHGRENLPTEDDDTNNTQHKTTNKETERQT
jgi:hypothetical protein